jgi:ribosomal protein S18 acetylase RimI-like enzyme
MDVTLAGARGRRFSIPDRFRFARGDAWGRGAGCGTVGVVAPVELVELDGAEDWPLWRASRLAALSDSPEAFPFAEAQWARGGEVRWRERLMDAAARGAVDGGRAGLHSLWVSPAVRGSALGDRLVGAVEEWAVRQGVTSVRLEVVPGNTAAIALYRRRGFVDTAVVGAPLPGGGHELVMEKPLGR